MAVAKSAYKSKNAKGWLAQAWEQGQGPTRGRGPRGDREGSQDTHRARTPSDRNEQGRAFFAQVVY